MRLGVIISLGASTTLGLGALLVAKVWMPAHAAHPVAPVAAITDGVPVVTAAQPIPYGVKLEAKYLKVSRMPASAAPAGAYASVDQVLSQVGGAPVALAPMTTQEAVLPTKLSGPGERLTLAAMIGEGLRAYTIGVTEVSGGAGHVMPGDRVDVVLTRELPHAPALDGQASRRMVSQVVIQNLRVLGIDQNANPSSTQPAVGRTATLEVSMPDALKLALAAQTGTLSLALRKPGATEIETVRPMLVNDLGSDAIADAPRRAVRTPVARHHPPAQTRMAANGGGMAVTVVQGDARANVQVPSEGANL